MILAAHQPQYLAYTGYFDKMDRADIFVLLDTVQYKKNEWINRNRVKGPNGVQFITVPVSHKFGESIKDVAIAGNVPWKKKHLQTLRTCYARASYFSEFFELTEAVLSEEWIYLAPLNIALIERIARQLGVATRIEIASALPDMPEQPDRRLAALCKYFDCDTYLAGAGGRDYMDLSIWREEAIEIVFHDYTEPVRKQLFGGFEPNLSVADLYMNEGSGSIEILRNAR